MHQRGVGREGREAITDLEGRGAWDQRLEGKGNDNGGENRGETRGDSEENRKVLEANQE